MRDAVPSPKTMLVAVLNVKGVIVRSPNSRVSQQKLSTDSLLSFIIINLHKKKKKR